MKKRLICLTMSILMLLACVLTGCSGTDKTDEGEESTVDNSAKTITMWVVTSDETTEEAKKLVNEEFTKITKSKFKTNVVIKFCTEDEYYEKLEGAINASQAKILLEEEASKALRQYLRAHKGEKSVDELTKDFYIENPQYAEFQEVEEEEDEDAPVTEEETVVNEFGITEIKYPDEKENQVDIFYLSGYNKYMEYYNAEWLSLLGEELSTSSKKLTDYISTSLLSGVQIEGGVYAIPNNVAIGEYTYMMIDKALFDTYYQKIDKVGSVLDLATFLNDVKNYNGDKTPDDPDYVVPLASTYEECIKMLCWYWDLNYIDQSVYETKLAEDNSGRYYVVKKQYEVEVEVEKGDETIKEKQTLITNQVKPDVVYKTNDLGQFVDENGNALNYHYEIDPEQGWLYDEKKDKYTFGAEGKGALYLVDENGDPVTPENDARVEIEAETKTDADGNPRATYYYSFDTDCEFSVLGTMMKDAARRSRGLINLGFNSLFTSTEYHNLYATLMDYDYQNFYGEVKEGQRAAVSFMKGDARIKQTYEKDGVYIGEDGKEYYVVVAEYPEATEEELYGNMFAVYANSSHLARSMKVITYLNTNKELRDLLQYGVLDHHYELNEDGTAHLLSNNQYGIYRMDIEKTGNCFIATPPESLGPDAWTYAKTQNNDSLINPLLGFDFNLATADSDYSLDVDLIDHIKDLNAEALTLINDCTNKDELMELLSDSDDGLVRKFALSSGDAKLSKATNASYDPDVPTGDPSAPGTPDKSGSSPYAVYQTWLTTYGYAYVPSAED